MGVEGKGLRVHSEFHASLSSKTLFQNSGKADKMVQRIGVLGTEFKPPKHHGIRRKLTSVSCSLTATCTLQTQK